VAQVRACVMRACVLLPVDIDARILTPLCDLSNKNNPAWVTQWLGTRGGVADKPRAAPSRSPAAAQVAYDSPMSAPGPTKAPF
jgi:hypothetical protein